jgi:hypothetical protein
LIAAASGRQLECRVYHTRSFTSRFLVPACVFVICAKNVRQRRVEKQKSTRANHGVKKSKYKFPSSFKKEKLTSSSLTTMADNGTVEAQFSNRQNSIDIYGPDS